MQAKVWGRQATAERSRSPCRLAMHCAGLTAKELALGAKIEYHRLRDLTLKRPRSGGTLAELYRIADACNVPRRFMEEGFAPLLDQPELSELRDRLAADERQLRDVTAPAPPAPGVVAAKRGRLAQADRDVEDCREAKRRRGR